VRVDELSAQRVCRESVALVIAGSRMQPRCAACPSDRARQAWAQPPSVAHTHCALSSHLTVTTVPVDDVAVGATKSSTAVLMPVASWVMLGRLVMAMPLRVKVGGVTGGGGHGGGGVPGGGGAATADTQAAAGNGAVQCQPCRLVCACLQTGNHTANTHLEAVRGPG
jgi:hypothetical protein